MEAAIAQNVGSKKQSMIRTALVGAVGIVWIFAGPSGMGPRVADAAPCCFLSADTARGPLEEPYVANFEKGSGRVVIVPRWKGQFIQIIVEADGLDDTAYEAFVEREDGAGGVTMGPDNLQLAYGRKVAETMMIPSRGRLLAWYVCPERIIAGTRARVVLRRVQPAEVVAQSELFEIRRPAEQ